MEPQIRFRGMEPLPSVEVLVRERTDHLARIHDRITFCNVVVEAQHRRSRKHKVYQVVVDVAVPGHTIVVGKNLEENRGHEDVYVAVRESFDAAERRLEDVVRLMNRHHVRPHPETLHGTVARLMSDDSFGFIQTEDGREFFFRREDMASDSDWQKLEVDTQVHFREHEGEKGPYATAVSPA